MVASSCFFPFQIFHIFGIGGVGCVVHGYSFLLGIFDRKKGLYIISHIVLPKNQNHPSPLSPIYLIKWPTAYSLKTPFWFSSMPDRL